jgi:exopolysaccharide biosynthesis polyprenyl glycosylphosphotransferase
MRTKNWLLLTGDVALMYASLVLALALRGGAAELARFWEAYFAPFTFVNIAWVAVFFIADFYSGVGLRTTTKFFRILASATAVNAALAVGFFYAITVFGIAPKTNLALYLAVFTALFVGWRWIFGRVMLGESLRTPIVTMNADDRTQQLADQLGRDETSGYRCLGHLDDGCDDMHRHAVLLGLMAEGGLLVLGPHGQHPTPELMYDLVRHGVGVVEPATLWEETRFEVPLSVTNVSWFVQNFPDSSSRRPFMALKRLADLAGAALIALAAAPAVPFIALAVRRSGPGPIFFEQVRMGRFGRPFRLYKFRTMVADAEKHGAQWSTKGDARVTRVGKFLRHTHLDELPQLWNILRGEMSFIGPRPERPEFVRQLERDIPYYELRHLVKPGITGWAQINYRYGASVEDARRKLELDLYYIKNQSAFTEIKVALKTVLMVFRGEGR